ncbi:hypothetical protein FAES_3226 [Fibrella aestuarina BUZ 2]|uniref:Uncharacterized protein n=1 Tax=Fibrella aestuarina BUZ 2 TaxID=1166018 RepID=I0KAT2_9BACT|nr:glycosyl hydrolase 108 family protein [Fibrella aestuarina]CCH01235.1 hypothetical protein FAES_3226 [Fibrella aestuarina BUZ 2]
MADFLTAYRKTMGHEGGYANHPDDEGGETFAGIARNSNPGWSGWKLIDQLKKTYPRARWDEVMLGNADLMAWVRALYKANYWDVNRLDQVKSQAIANELFDTGVNMGVEIAAEFLQRALNMTNENAKLYRDIAVDRQVGPMTLGLLNTHPNSYDVYKWLNVLQGARYVQILERKTPQEVFARSWISRVDFVKI